MSDHVWAQENLGASITHGLSAEEQERFDRHLASCRPCQETLAETRQLEQVMNDVFASVRPDAGLEDRAITHLRAARISRPGLWRFVGAAAAVILVGAVGAAMQTVVADGSLAFPGMQLTKDSGAGSLLQGIVFSEYHPNQEGAHGRSITGGKIGLAMQGVGNEVDLFETKFKESLGGELSVRMENFTGQVNGRGLWKQSGDVRFSDLTDTVIGPTVAQTKKTRTDDDAKPGAIGQPSVPENKVTQDRVITRSNTKGTLLTPDSNGNNDSYMSNPTPTPNFSVNPFGGSGGNTNSALDLNQLQPSVPQNPFAFGQNSISSPSGRGFLDNDGTVRGMPDLVIPTPNSYFSYAKPSPGLSYDTRDSFLNANGNQLTAPTREEPKKEDKAWNLPNDKNIDSSRIQFAPVFPLSSQIPWGVASGYANLNPNGGPGIPPTEAFPGFGHDVRQGAPSVGGLPGNNNNIASQATQDRVIKRENKKLDDAALVLPVPTNFGNPGQGGAVGGDPNAVPGAIATHQPKPPEAEPAPRKIIRTGNMDFVVDSFDIAVEAATKLINGVKGGFIATVNSDKLPNGKMRGSVVVRMPPQFLDKFILDLRRDLAKGGELVNQKIGSQDVTKQYYDLESRLKAARSMEERLIRIIKDGKGEIKDLIVAERELGVWRTKIEEMEGEIRYYGNQVSLSTLTIGLVEKEIQAPFAVVVKETVKMKLEADDVEKAYQAALAEVAKLKGRVTKSDLKQHAIGKLDAIIIAEIAAPSASAFTEALKKLGVVRDHVAEKTQQSEGGTGAAHELKPRLNDVTFEVILKNLTSLVFAEKVVMRIEVDDVEKAHAAALADIAAVKGRVTKSEFKQLALGQLEAIVHAEIAPAGAPAFRAALQKLGIVQHNDVQRSQYIEGDADRPQDLKPRYKDVVFEFALNNTANIQPRDSFILLVAAPEVADAFRKLQDIVAKIKGQVRNSNLDAQDAVGTKAQIDFDVPTEAKETVEKLLADLGQTLSRNNAQVPVNEISTNRKIGYRVTLRNAADITPREAFDLKVATLDVSGSYRKLKNAVEQAKGRMLVHKSDEKDKINAWAQLSFIVPVAAQAAIDKLLTEIGETITRGNLQVPINEIATERRVGYAILLVTAASQPPRENVVMRIEVKDVKAKATELSNLVRASKGTVADFKTRFKETGQMTVLLKFDVPMSAKEALLRQFTESGKVLDQDESRNPQVPDNDLALAHIDILLSSRGPIVPDDEGLWPKIRTSLYYSFTIFSWSISLVVLGVSVLLPWALVVWVVIRVVQRMRGKPQAAPTV